MPSLKFRIDGEAREAMIPAASTWTALQNSLKKSFPLSSGLSDLHSLMLVNAAGEVIVAGINDAKSFWHAVSSSYKATCYFAIEKRSNDSSIRQSDESLQYEPPGIKTLNFTYDNATKLIPIPTDAKWRDIVSSVKRVFNIASSISHFVLVDDSGDDFSADLDTPEKFWKIASRYGSGTSGVKSDFSFKVFTQSLHDSIPTAAPRAQVSKATAAPLEPMAQRSFEVHLDRLGLVNTSTQETVVITVPALCSWEHIIRDIEVALRLDSGSVNYLVPISSLTGAAKKITSRSAFWKLVSDADARGAVVKWGARLSSMRLGSFDYGESPSRVLSRSTDSKESDEEPLSVAMAHSPDDVRFVIIRRNSSWKDVIGALSRTFNLPKSQAISHLTISNPSNSATRVVFNSEELWATPKIGDCNIRIVLESANGSPLTTSITKPQTPEYVARTIPQHKRTPLSDVSDSPSAAAIRFAPEAPKLLFKATLMDGSNDSADMVFYDAPTWEDFADRLGFLFKVSGRGVDFVIFVDKEGDEVSGPVNNDAKLKRALGHHENTYTFNVFLTKNALLSRRVNIKTALASNPERFVDVCLPRLPKWAEARKEVARTFHVAAESISHFIYLNNSGEEASGNLNSDIKITAFFEQFDPHQYSNLTLSVFLHSRTKNPEAKMSTLINFYALCLENRSSELDSYADQVDVDAINPDTCTSAFLECCKLGKLDSIKWLVKNGADINQKLDDGCSGLHLAIMHNQNDVISFLITSGASIFEPNKRQMNPLMTACYCGNRFAVELLFRKGARISEMQATHGAQPIHIAAYAGNLDIVEWLFEASGISNIDFVYHPHNKTLMMYAAEGGSVSVMEWLRAKGMRVTHKGSVPGQEGFTALHYAALAARVEATRWLLKQGIALHEKCLNGSTALSIATKLGHTKVANAIMDFILQGKKTLDVDVILRMLANMEFDRARSYLESFFRAIKFETSPVDGPMCMWIAASCSHFVILEYLFLCGFDVDCAGWGGSTPLMGAISNSQFDMVKFLIRCGANIQAVNDKGESPLSLSYQIDNEPLQAYVKDVYDYVTILQKKSQFSIFSCVSGPQEIPPDLLDRISEQDIGMLNPSIKQLSAPKYPLETMCKYPLHCCIKIGASMDLITLLVEAEQDLEVVDDEGITALYHAVLCQREPVIDLLVSRGAKVMRLSSVKHATPLHHICSLGLYDALAKIIDLWKVKKTEGFTWDDCKDASGGTPVHAAVLGNSIEALTLLLERAEMSMNSRGPCDRTPLILSCIHNFDDITKYLLDRGADVNLPDCFGRTAIMYVMKRNDLNLVQYFVRMGASVQQRSRDGVSLMFIACENNNLDAMKWLYSKKLSIMDRTGDNLSLLDVAQARGFHEICEWVTEMRGRS
jgi:ankyrin repeat protein